VKPPRVPGIFSGRDLDSDLVLDVGAVVIGTGAGGSIALRELARAGIDVIALEEGSDHIWSDFDQREETMLPELFQDRAGRMTDDFAINVLQGRGVGGSTIHNTNLCKRTPAEILDLWARKHRVTGCTAAEMNVAFETIERDLHVTRIPDDAINANNDVLRRGVQALGWRGGVLSHNRDGCVRSGFCEVGCAYDGKNNARKVVVPQAIERGARVYADVRVTRILHDGRQVKGVEARAESGRRVVVRAKVVVLSASAVNSAALAIVSDVPDPHAQLGRRLHIHPGAAIAAVFDGDRDEPIQGWRGIPQSYECTEWIDFAEGSDRRVWITTAFAHPVGTAAGIPGFGAAHMTAMRRYPRMAVLTAMVHDETIGTVYVNDDGRPAMRYTMIESDRAQMAQGVRACAELLLAAGAREVVVPAIPPRPIRTRADIAQIDTSVIRPHGLALTAVHPMGTMRLGDDETSSVVRSTGEHHQLKGLFVLDGSLFPTSIGGPPQISIYAFAQHLAPHAVDAAR
jgi:choline dehydrogenase-like flavoprotein